MAGVPTFGRVLCLFSRVKCVFRAKIDSAVVPTYTCTCFTTTGVGGIGTKWRQAMVCCVGVRGDGGGGVGSTAGNRVALRCATMGLLSNIECTYSYDGSGFAEGMGGRRG